MAESLGPVVNNWRVRNKSTVTATENGRVRIKTECFINSANGYWFSGLTVHGGAAVNGQWNTFDQTNVSIAQNAGVGLVAKEIWVNRTKATQSILCTAEARVSGFAAGTSRSDVRISVPPLPSHTVSYNANGGSGAPGNQTKWWGEFLTLSNTRPTRANHTFLGWATSANGAVQYQPGGRYGADNNNTLYAKWKLNAQPPTIQSFTAQRVNEAGDMSESGTRVKLYVTWKCDTSGDSANTVQSVTIAVQDGGTWKDTQVTASGATGTGTVTLTGLSADSSWRFRATVRDKYGTVTSFTTVGPQRFLLDFSPDGRGTGIGVGAPAEGVSIYGKPIRMDDGEAGIEITSTDGSSIYVGAKGININNPRYGHMRLDDNGLNIHNDQGWGLSVSAGGWRLDWAGNHTLATGPKAGALYLDGKEIKTV